MVAEREKMMGTTVHQVDLSAQGGHRWNAPISQKADLSGGTAQKGREELLLGSTGDSSRKSPEYLGLWAWHLFGKGCRAGDGVKCSQNRKKEFSKFFYRSHRY